MRRLFLLTGLLSFLLIVLLLSSSITTNPPFTNREFMEDESTEAQDAQGYIDWMVKVRGNQNTGTIDLNDVMGALKQADEQSSVRDLNISWEEMGPDNVGGRTRAVLYDRFQPGVVFAGGVSGGLWKSTNNGQTWTKYDDNLSVLTVASIAEGADGSIYFGTGEGLYANYGIGAGGFPGQGIWKSTDGGNTFTQLTSTIPNPLYQPSAAWSEVNRIGCSPTDPNLIFAATDKGLKRSIDGGSTWSDAGGISSAYNVKDVKVGNDGWVYCCAANKYWRSTDNTGSAFTNHTGVNGFPSIPSLRVELAVSPSSPNVVYALVVSSPDGPTQGIYKSTDNGDSWTTIGVGSASFNITGSGTYNQGDYDIALGVVPDDPDMLYAGGVLYLWRWTPPEGWLQKSGYTSLSYYIHPDMHAIAFNPNNPNEMIVGCDGGLFRTTNAKDAQPLFMDANRNYNVTQMYSVSAAPTGEVMGGTQDNGTQYIDFLGNSTKAATSVYGGDGGYSEISKTNSNAFFAATPNGFLVRSSSKGASFGQFLDCHSDHDPAGASNSCGGDGYLDDGGDFVTPFILWEDPTDSARAYFATGGNTYPWFTKEALNFSATPTWFRFPSISGTVTATAFSPDGDALWIGTGSGSVIRYSNILSVDANGKFHYPNGNALAATWNAIDSGIVKTSISIPTGGRYIRSIAFDKNNPDNVVVCAANYGNTQYVWRSTNGSQAIPTFSDITHNLPHMPVYSVCVPTADPNTILAGTELGVWSYDIPAQTWTEQNDGMARVPTLMVREIPYNGLNYIYLGTHGRGIWRSGSFVGINSPKDNPVYNLNVFPNPVSEVATIRFSLSKAGLTNVKIYNLQGSIVWQETETLSAGEALISVDTKEWSQGTYIISASSRSAALTHKLIVLR